LVVFVYEIKREAIEGKEKRDRELRSALLQSVEEVLDLSLFGEDAKGFDEKQNLLAENSLDEFLFFFFDVGKLEQQIGDLEQNRRICAGLVVYN
jgi:hypothetical protein